MEVSAAMTSIFRYLADHFVDDYCAFCFFPLKEYPLPLIRLLLSFYMFNY